MGVFVMPIIKNGEYRNCLTCDKEFYVQRAKLNRGGGKYCSVECRGKDKRNGELRICKTCRKEFYAYSKKIEKGEGIYCSTKCSILGRKEGKEITCPVCGKVFYVPKHRFNKKTYPKYCSLDCFGIAHRRPNNIRIDGNIAYIELTDKNGHLITEAIIGTEDIDKVNAIGYRWRLQCGIKNGGYVVTDTKEGIIFLHRVVMDCPEGIYIDHINNNKLDCTKNNLRHCTYSQNRQNINPEKIKLPKSGVRNVTKHYGKWRARITVQGKVIDLGHFYTLEEAEAAVIAGRKKYFTHSKENLPPL